MGIEVTIFPYRKWPPLSGTYEAFKLENQVFATVIPPKQFGKRILLALHLLWKNRRHAFRLLKTLNFFILGKSAADLTVFYGAIPFLDKPPFDLIIAHFGENGIGMEKMIRCGFLKAPLITVFHGYDIHWQSHNFLQKQAAYRKLFLHGQAFVANGKYGREKLKVLGAPPDKCFIIPAGFNTDPFRNVVTVEPTFNHFCSVGRLIELKGHKFALKALAVLYKKGFTQWVYTVAGDGEQMEVLRNQAIQSGIGNQVKLPGYLSPDEVRELLGKSTVYIHPSITDNTGRAETQGLAIQEAQAMGLPIVAFASGGIPDGVPAETGILVPEGDVEGLANALQTLMESPQLRQKMGEAGRQWALEHYDVLKLNQKILDLAEIFN
jgi:colanic acid/amylovoran biosynthesis glycosyltransferase